MATPHVSGLVAYILGLDSSLSPAQVDAAIKQQALNNVISGVREYHPQLHRSCGIRTEVYALFQPKEPRIV